MDIISIGIASMLIVPVTLLVRDSNVDIRNGYSVTHSTGKSMYPNTVLNPKKEQYLRLLPAKILCHKRPS
jgi:hypothetical protein